MGSQFAVAERATPTSTLRPRAPEQHTPTKRPSKRPLPTGVQPKLLVGPADDPFEREAEHTADAVMAGNHSIAGATAASGVAHRLLRYAQRAIGKAEPPTKKDDDERTKQLQKMPSGVAGPDVVPAGVEAGIASMSTSGHALPARPFFESRFGFDFSDVRVHTGPQAEGAAAALGARAFTVGNDIYFGSGELQPATPAGQRLIAHELTHTIQQKGSAARAARLLAAPRRVQRIAGMPDTVAKWIRDFIVKDFPPWDLITLIIGFDPIRDVAVKGGFRDWLRAALKIVPNGEALFDKLDKEGKIEAVQKWWDAEIAKLDLSLATITDLVKRGWDAVGGLDLLDPAKAWNDKIKPIIAPTIARVVNFVKAVGAKVFEVAKDIGLHEVGEWAKAQKGYPLLTMVLGRDPVTGEPVTPTLKGVIFAVLDLVDGGEKIKENLEKSKTIEKAAAWFKSEVKTLDLTWDGIKLLFSQAWDAFKVVDLLNPKQLLDKMWGIFGPPVTRLIKFLIAVGKKVLEFIFEGAMLIAGPIGLRIVAIFRKIGGTFQTIIDDPVAFLGHLVDGMKKGVAQFAKNIWEHLKTGVIGWLTGTLGDAGLVLPKVWDLRGILDLVLQILGITYAKVRVKLVKVLGERTVSTLEKVFGFIKTLVTEGPAAAWKEIVAAIGSLWDLVIGGIKDWAVTKIVTAAITKLVSMLNPAGAVIQAIIATYNTVAFFIERINQILDFVEAVIDSIANIAQGKIAAAANWIEKAMARSIPVLLGFLARLIGLGDVSERIKKVIGDIHAKVDKGIDKVIDWVVAKAKSIVGFVKDKAGKLLEWWKSKAKFHTDDDEDHEVSIDGEGPSSSVIVRSTPRQLTEFFSEWEAAIPSLNKSERTKQQNELEKARKIAGKVESLRSKLAIKGGDNDKARQDDADSLTDRLRELAAALGRRAVGRDVNLPAPILPSFVKNVRAPGTLSAQFISKKLLDKGTKTSDAQSPVSWDQIPTKWRGDWVKMHLLTAALGGEAADSNLVPARRLTNKHFDLESETPAYNALKNGNDDIIWYEVKVAFHQGKEIEDEYDAGFPSSVEMKWGGYSKDQATGKRIPAPGGNHSEQLSLPDFDSPPAREVNYIGRGRMRNALGITPADARKITEMRDAKKFVNQSDFLRRVGAEFGTGFITDKFKNKVRKLVF
jgi:hypothetical protein